MPPPLYYAPSYNFSWEGHVFPVGKYRRLRDRLLAEGVAKESEIAEAPALTEPELLALHRPSYITRLLRMPENPDQGVLEFEGQCTQAVLDGFLAMGGGTLAACRAALTPPRDAAEPRFAANLGGGLHHAFPWKGEGFCAINDIAIALSILLDEGKIHRAAVLDLDVHQGNGTAKCFERDPRVFTASLHQDFNYPVKQRSDLDRALPDGCKGAVYLEALGEALAACLAARPELLVYVAGADPYVHDRLGGLALEKPDFRARDAQVFHACRKQEIPVVALLAGGYAEAETDVVDIHFEMLKAGLRR